MVELLNYFGNDDNHTNVARVSYGKEASNYTEEQNARLINYLVKHGHCYDEETEVLTSEGFKKWRDVNRETLLGSVDPDNRYFLGFEKPLDLVEKFLNEDMIHFKTSDLDLKVTKGHSLYCSKSSTVYKRSNPEYKLEVACLVDRYGVPTYKKPMRMVKTSFNPSTGGNPELYSLYGFFIGDGHASIKSRNRLSFHLKKERKIKYLTNLCEILGLELRELEGGNFVVFSENIGWEFRRLFYNEASDKTFPNNFYSMTREEYKGFKEGLVNSDGHLKRQVKVYDTSSRQLADKLQALSSINGDVVTISRSNGIYRLNFSTRSTSPRLNDNKTNRVQEVPYKGKVYCATVSRGLLIVRRNDKVVLCGNTSPFRHSTLQYRIKCPIYVERQIFKHQIGISVNSISGRYVDFSDSYYEIGQFRTQSKDSKQGSGGDLPDDLNKEALEIQGNVIETCKIAYERLVEIGVSKEQARSVLPLSLETEFIWTGSFLALMHLFDLRLKDDTQKETRGLVKEMLQQVVNIPNNPFKYSLKAFGF